MAKTRRETPAIVADTVVVVLVDEVVVVVNAVIAITVFGLAILKVGGRREEIAEAEGGGGEEG